MTDKVQKIREEVERLRNLHQIKYQHLDTNDNMCLVECGKRNLCNELLSFIASLQEEPVSEELSEEIDYLSRRYPEVSFAKLSRIAVHVAKWQKQQTINKACEWIEEINNHHHIMRYADSCEPPLSELTEWFKNYMKGE